MIDIASVLGGGKSYEGPEEDYEYMHLAHELAEALGVSKEKGEAAAKAICALVRYEQEKSGSVTIKVG